MRKSESVCSFCLARRNVADPVCERTRSQDGPQEKTGMARFVPKRTRQMPGQLSCPLRYGCRKKCSSEGAVEAENGIRTSSSYYAACIVLVGSTLFLKLIPITDILLGTTISIFKGWGFRDWNMGLSMGVLVYRFEVGVFLQGCG